MFVGIGRHINWLWVTTWMVIVFCVSVCVTLTLWRHSQADIRIGGGRVIRQLIEVKNVSFPDNNTVSMVLHNNDARPHTVTEVHIDRSKNLLANSLTYILQPGEEVALSVAYPWKTGEGEIHIQLVVDGHWV